MAAVTQDNRLIAIDTPLGKDKLLLRSFSGVEGISQMFSFQLDLLSEDYDIDFNAVLAEKASIGVELPGGGKRYFHGHIHRFMQVAGTPRFARYHAELIPKFFGLKRQHFCRIYQNMTGPQIVEEILGHTGIDYELQLHRGYRNREYCVMYRESVADFAMRLMEEEGIYFYFKHEKDKHTMVLADSTADYAPLAPARVEYARTLGTGRIRPDDRVLSWRREMCMISGQFSLRDYNFETPNNDLEVSIESKLKDAVGEVYDYPGEYDNNSQGDEYVRIRIEEEEARRDVVSGTSTCREMTSGYKFQLINHPRKDQNGPYVLTSVTHSAVSNYEAAESGADYSNSFTCIPASTPFRPPRTTPVPVVEGTQTAVVVGPKGEEIYTDKYGRVKVQFHWDRKGKNEKSSCFVRVATPWAGKNWGMVHIPRIGQEVVVDFLEGDPDRPLIIGSVYNAEQMPPYGLPANQTQSGIKSRSSKGGGSDDFNELRFEDKKGSEDVYFHAQKDFHRVVENDDVLKVGNDQTNTIHNNQTSTIEIGDQTTTIKMGNQTLTIKMGNQKVAIDLGKSETEALQSIELKVGQSSVKLDQTGVTIKGMMIKVEGQITTDIKAPMTTVNGDAMLIAKGGLTMIN